MDSIFSFFANLGLNLPSMLKLAVILFLGALLLNGFNHFIFHKQTIFSHAISASIAIIFIYALLISIFVLAVDLRFLLSPLPFITLSEDTIRFFQFSGTDYTVIASELLSIVILAFLVGITDSLIPSGKKVISWFLFRILTVGIAIFLHNSMTMLVNRYFPDGLLLYAPTILLALLVLMLLTGALRFLVGLLLTTVSPIIAAFYTFFFATLIGKQITKAIFTAGILSGVILLLEKLGIFELALSSGALVAYIPFLLILLPVWYWVSE